jgi:hypothetical protein
MIKKRLIVFHPPSPDDASMFDAPLDVNGTAPWVYVRNRFAEMDIEVKTSYRISDVELAQAEKVVLLNLPGELAGWVNRLRDRLGFLRGRQRAPGGLFWNRCRAANVMDRLAVILFEPPVVQPETYVAAVHRSFSTVFTWSRQWLGKGGKYAPIVAPQQIVTRIPVDIAFDQRKLLCNFSGHKHSSHPQELYSARERTIGYMEAHHLDQFEHFGPGWSEQWPSWKGMVPDKFEVYPRFRFGLCYENMRDEPGYITEKIIDCLAAGTVPVYWGCPEIAEQVPEGAYVDKRQFDDEASMVAYLQAMPAEQWQRMRAIGMEYVRSDRFSQMLGAPALFGCLERGLFSGAARA